MQPDGQCGGVISLVESRHVAWPAAEQYFCLKCSKLAIRVGADWPLAGDAASWEDTTSAKGQTGTVRRSYGWS